jgi:hypothetical protein
MNGRAATDGGFGASKGRKRYTSSGQGIARQDERNNNVAKYATFFADNSLFKDNANK